MRLLPLALLGAFLTCAQTGSAVDLKPETVEAFDHYVADLEAKLEPRFKGNQFLWCDETPALRDQLMKGMILVRPANGNGLLPVKNGLIQDWMGAVFVPQTTLKSVLTVIEDYDRHQEIYAPDVAVSKMQSHQADEFQVFLRIVKAKFFLSVVLNSEHKIRYYTLDPKRVYSRSYSTRIAEVAGPGKPGEHELPVGQDRGMLWRLYSYWFFEERDGGVYITSQNVSLTRDMPLGMGKLLAPILRDLPGESLQTSLEQTRKAVAGKK